MEIKYRYKSRRGLKKITWRYFDFQTGRSERNSFRFILKKNDNES